MKTEKFLLFATRAFPDEGGIRVHGETHGLNYKDKIFGDTRSGGTLRQSIGLRLEEEFGPVTHAGNLIEATPAINASRAEEFVWPRSSVAPRRRPSRTPRTPASHSRNRAT